VGCLLPFFLQLHRLCRSRRPRPLEDGPLSLPCSSENKIPPLLIGLPVLPDLPRGRRSNSITKRRVLPPFTLFLTQVRVRSHWLPIRSPIKHYTSPPYSPGHRGPPPFPLLPCPVGSWKHLFGRFPPLGAFALFPVGKPCLLPFFSSPPRLSEPRLLFVQDVRPLLPSITLAPPTIKVWLTGP